MTASSWSDAGLPKYVTVVGRGGLVSIGIDKTSSLDLRVAMEKGSLGANASVLVEGSGGISGMSFSAGIQQGCIDAPTPLLQPCYTPADVQGTLVPFGMGNWHAPPAPRPATCTAHAASTARRTLRNLIVVAARMASSSPPNSHPFSSTTHSGPCVLPSRARRLCALYSRLRMWRKGSTR